MLLILSSTTDLTADYLIVELAKRDLRFFRLNSEDLAEASYRVEFDDRGARRTICVGPRSVDLEQVDAIWYRRAITPNALNAPTADVHRFVSGELRHLVAGAIFNPTARWVNPIERVFAAEHKLYQLRVAQQHGLQIPRTIVSGDQAVLREFVESNKSTICKPIYHGLFRNGADRYAIYTRRVSAESLNEDLGCPVLLQEEVPRGCDVRATFIGDKVFVADIVSDYSLIDWRDPSVKVTYRDSRLDADTEAKCRKVLESLGLIFGAFDFIRRPDGRLVFLEVNATGEWAWLEEALGYPMREAFIDTFYGR